jgi:Ca2+-binding RTX toxin-like protein
MPEGITKQTAKIFVMWMPDGENTYRQVIVQGTKLTYDADTGMITGGVITSLRYNFVTDDGKTVQVTQSFSWGGLNMDAASLAEAFGTTMWNHIKVVTERFGVLDTLHEGVLRGHYDGKDAWMLGTDKANRLQGTGLSEAIDGRDGNDTLYGRHGDDTLTGGDGDDRLLGGTGNDVLTDTAGKTNAFSGGAGDDRIMGGAGNDQMSGDIGNDTFIGNGGLDSASGGRGTDTFVFDMKAEGTLRIYDFTIADDLLINAQAANAKEAYVNFMDHATQVGRNVEYHDGGQTVVLMKVRLDQIQIENFAGSETPPDLLM